MNKLLITEAPFDAGAELASLAATGAGGIASFIGAVRAADERGAALAALHLEHYPGLTQAALARLAEAATMRFDLAGVVIIHRVGRLLPGEMIVLAATASSHRGPALEAVGFIADQLKTAIPFWKAEELPDGTKQWLAPKAADEALARNWLETWPADANGHKE
jgi:molybdopterin synthase catalytic subunit